MAGQNSDFGNIESRREEKYRLKKIWRRVNLLLFFVLSWATIYFMFMSDEASSGRKKINLLDFVVVDFTNISESSLNIPLYYGVGFLLMFTLWGVFAGKSKMEMLEEAEELASRGKKPGFMHAIRFKTISILDKGTYILFYPLSFFIIPIDSSSTQMKEKFYIRYGWLGHLEKTFFKKIMI